MVSPNALEVFLQILISSHSFDILVRLYDLASNVISLVFSEHPRFGRLRDLLQALTYGVFEQLSIFSLFVLGFLLLFLLLLLGLLCLSGLLQFFIDLCRLFVQNFLPSRLRILLFLFSHLLLVLRRVEPLGFFLGRIVLAHELVQFIKLMLGLPDLLFREILLVASNHAQFLFGFLPLSIFSLTLLNLV